MDDSQTYMNVKFEKADTQSPSRDGLNSTFSELNIRKDEPPINEDEDPPFASGCDLLKSTYSVLKLRKDELLIDEDEDPPIASGCAKMSVTGQAEGLDSTYSVLKLRKDELLIDEDEDPPIASGPAKMSVTGQAEGLDSTYSVLKLRKDELLIDEYEDPPTASGPAEMSVTGHADSETSTYTALNLGKDKLLIDGLNSTYSVLNLRKDNLLRDEYTDPPIAPGPAGMSVIAQAGPHKQESKENFGNRSHRKICLLCLVTCALIAIVAAVSIFVSQTRQSLITSNRNYRRLWEQHQEMNRTQRQYQQQVHELNSTLKSRTFEHSRLHLSQRNCLKNISALNNNLSNLENNFTILNSELSELNQTHTDLRHECNQLETKYRIITETKDQICQYLNRRREQTCPPYWTKEEGRCYFISTSVKSYDGAREHCSKFDARLLEINSNVEKNFVSNDVTRYTAYWIGKCANRNVASYLLYKVSYGWATCSKCDSYAWSYDCKGEYRFICEKSAYLYLDIPEEIQGLCQQPVGPTSIK
ncbi:uncharacterized protein [Mobula birostris]|uniref:uncharacterized protein isoform X4 n=1 Tax=Mobula birostris TaxID=1983395 RepID=UPI003B27CADC